MVTRFTWKALYCNGLELKCLLAILPPTRYRERGSGKRMKERTPNHPNLSEGLMYIYVPLAHRWVVVSEVNFLFTNSASYFEIGKLSVLLPNFLLPA